MLCGLTAAWLACLFRHTWPDRIVLALILAAGIAAAADALRPWSAYGESILGLVAAGVMCWTAYGLALVPIAAAVEGCPLAWPLSPRHFGLPRPLPLTTGTWGENWHAAPGITGTLRTLAPFSPSLLPLMAAR
jgi:hypothetical protein